MNIIYGGRGAGKTTRLIEKSEKDRGYIVCHSKGECSRIFAQAERMKINIPFPMTYAEFITGDYRGARISGFHIDNVDMLLSHLCGGVPLKTVTLTPFGSITNLCIDKLDLKKLRKKFGYINE